MGVSVRKLFTQTFEGHKGRPGEIGGSLPASGSSVSIKDAEQDWFDNYFEGGVSSDTEQSLQSAAENENVGQKRMLRGEAFRNLEEFRNRYKPGKRVTLEKLTAVTLDRKIATIYSDPQYIGETEGIQAIIHIENPNGLHGHQFSIEGGTEAVLPKGDTYKVTRVWEEGGYYNVTLYSTQKVKQNRGLFRQTFEGHKGRKGIGVGGSLPRGSGSSVKYREFDHNRSGDTMIWGKQLFNESELSEEDIAALKDYKGSSFALNDWLRADGYSNLDKNPNKLKINKVQKLDSAISSSKLPEAVLAFRGINRNAIGPDNGDYTGVEFMDKGFISTTLHIKSALGWSWNNQDPVGTVVQIQLPKGSSAMYMDDIYDRGEYELLLPRNTKFRVVKDETVDRFGAPDPWRLLTVEIIE